MIEALSYNRVIEMDNNKLVHGLWPGWVWKMRGLAGPTDQSATTLYLYF
jgi:hypothetical protein